MGDVKDTASQKATPECVATRGSWNLCTTCRQLYMLENILFSVVPTGYITIGRGGPCVIGMFQSLPKTLG